MESVYGLACGLGRALGRDVVPPVPRRGSKCGVASPALKDGASLYRPFRGVTVYIAPSGARQQISTVGLVRVCFEGLFPSGGGAKDRLWKKVKD